jgi:hypothetical protein
MGMSHFTRRSSAGTFTKVDLNKMKNQVSNARMSSIPYFSEIVKESHNTLIRLDEKTKRLKIELSQIESEDDGMKISSAISFNEDEMAKLSFIIIVFSAIAVESYIYDYAARHLGDTFVKENLDKLDTISKWVVIPELVTGRGLSRHQNWHGLLKRLFKTRNTITHYKSFNPPHSPTKDFWRKLEKFSSEIHETAVQSIFLLRLLADKISEIDPEETPWVKNHLA